MDTKLDEYSDEEMARLIVDAMKTPEGLNTIAAAIGPPIASEIQRTEITSRLLTRHKLAPGVEPLYVKKPMVKAYWIDESGQAMASDLKKRKVRFPTYKVHTMPMVYKDDLKHGNMISLNEIQKMAGAAIRKKIDKRTVRVISAAVPKENTITVTGGKLTENALNEAMAILEDQELEVKTIVLRGKRRTDIKGWDFDPVTDREFNQKGVFKAYGGAEILFSSVMPEDEVFVLPNEEFGRYPIREELTSETINEVKRFRIGWLVWMQVGQGKTRTDIISKIKILP